MSHDLASQQLKEVCHLTQARWVAWVTLSSGLAVFDEQSGLNKSGQKALQALLSELRSIEWLAGGLNSRRIRWREIAKTAVVGAARPLREVLNCQRIYLFPNGAAQRGLLVGYSPDAANKGMDKTSQDILRMFAMTLDARLYATARLTQPEPGSGNAPNLGQTLHAMASAMAITTDLDVWLQQMVQQVRGVCQAQGVEIYLLDRARRLQWAGGETPWEAAQSALIGEYIAATGKTVVIENTRQWVEATRKSKGEHNYSGKSAAYAAESMQGGAASAAENEPAAVPGWAGELVAAGTALKFQGELVGTLTVLREGHLGGFTSQEVQALTWAAPLLAVAAAARRQADLSKELQQHIQAQEVVEKRLVRAARLAAVGEMAAGVAHELNNPLTSVTGFVELALQELPADWQGREELELALKEALRARQVVRRLLDFSRPMEDQRVCSDINELVSQVLNLIRHMLRSGQIMLRIQLWDDLPQIAVDPIQIQQVLHNLLQNALQAMPAGGTLTIRTGLRALKGQSWIQIVVEDTGEGIPSENLSKIFEPFFTTRKAQLFASTNQEEAQALPFTAGDRHTGFGMGLGLAVSYGIVKSHGGFIEVESQVGAGSRFNVYLPGSESA